jgi:hypothetical protein
LVATLGISRTIETFNMEIKKTWHGRRYAVVSTVTQQERKGLKWVEVARVKNTVSIPMFDFTPDGHKRCKAHLKWLRNKQKEKEANDA